MDKEIKFKKIGNHWYPDIKHPLGYNISIPKKMELLFNIINIFDEITIIFKEIQFIDGEGILYFDDIDITRYLTTDDEFLLKFRVDDKYFSISSELYTLLENEFNFDFPSTLYKLDILC